MDGRPPSSRRHRRDMLSAPSLQALTPNTSGSTLGDWLAIWRSEPIAVLRPTEERDADRLERKWGHLPLALSLGLLEQEWQPGGERTIRGSLTWGQRRVLEDALGDAELVGAWPEGAIRPSHVHDQARASSAEAIDRAWQFLTRPVARRGATVVSVDRAHGQRAVRAAERADAARDTREASGSCYVVERLPQTWRVARIDMSAEMAAFDAQLFTMRQAAFRLLADAQHTYTYSGPDAEVVAAFVATLRELHWTYPVALAAVDVRRWCEAMQDISFNWRHKGGRPLDAALGQTRLHGGMEVMRALRAAWRGEDPTTWEGMSRSTLRRVRLRRLSDLAAHGRAHPELDAIEFGNLLAWRLPGDAVQVAWVSERSDAEAFVEVRTLDPGRALTVTATLEASDDWLGGKRRKDRAYRTACSEQCGGHVVQGGATRHICPPIPEVACAACGHRGVDQSTMEDLAWLDHHPDCPIGWAIEALPIVHAHFPRA